MSNNIYKAQVRIGMDGALPEDDVVNTWHFRGFLGTTRAADATTITDALQTFYQSIDGVIFPAELDNAATVTVYDLAEPKPRTPLSETALVLANGGGGGLPSECAVCLSYEAAQVSGLPQARRRGRVYLGPLTAGIVVNAAGGRHVLDTARVAIADAAGVLGDEVALSGVAWIVYSPTTATFEGDLDAGFLVTGGWVDDAFDTVRSRGPRSTTRSGFSI